VRLVALCLSLVAVPAPALAAVTEDQAIDLVARAMRRLHPEERPQCLSFITEEKSPKAFEIAVAENHKLGCGGDPGALTTIERFRVTRSPAGLWRWDAPADTYRRCRLPSSGRAVCPRLSYE
jgi:hypothetical protein